MHKQIKVIFSENAEGVYQELAKKARHSKQDQMLINAIDQKVEILKKYPFYGNQISKKLVPKEYSAENMWRIALPCFWRILYTIKGNQIEIVCFVIDIFEHKKYNKVFGYKKK